MSVYGNDVPEHFQTALASIINQSVVPDEIVLVVDGPVPLLINEIVTEYQRNYPFFKVVRLPENKGLGYALKVAVENAAHSLIARMDSDDISVYDRFEKQLNVFASDPDLSVLGGTICEFIDNQDNIVSVRNCPLTDAALKSYIKTRCPFNHMTVMMTKESVLRAGNYQSWYLNEDSYLWVRMLETGAKFKNLPDNLVYVRVGKDMYARRGGYRYFIKGEASLQKYMWQHHLIGFPVYVYNVMVRFVVQVLLPNGFRTFLYQTFFRTKPKQKKR
ncbi:MAG: glycosyltransferase [Bacteroidales bacterium]|nr:glycosyltransferase [Bacteroidales bacterium]